MTGVIVPALSSRRRPSDVAIVRVPVPAARRISTTPKRRRTNNASAIRDRSAKKGEAPKRPDIDRQQWKRLSLKTNPPAAQKPSPQAAWRFRWPAGWVKQFASDMQRKRGWNDRPLYLDDPQRPQDLDLARRGRLALSGAQDRNLEGRPVHPRVRRHQPQQQDPGDRRSRRPRGQEAGPLRVGRHPDLSGREDGQIPVRRPADQNRDAGMADVSD